MYHVVYQPHVHQMAKKNDVFSSKTIFCSISFKIDSPKPLKYISRML